MYRIYKTEHFYKRPDWVVPLLLEISPKNFTQPTLELARKELGNVEHTIRESRFFGKRNRFHIEKTDDSVSIVNSSGTPFISFCIEPFGGGKD